MFRTALFVLLFIAVATGVVENGAPPKRKKGETQYVKKRLDNLENILEEFIKMQNGKNNEFYDSLEHVSGLLYRSAQEMKSATANIEEKLIIISKVEENSTEKGRKRITQESRDQVGDGAPRFIIDTGNATQDEIFIACEAEKEALYKELSYLTTERDSLKGKLEVIATQVEKFTDEKVRFAVRQDLLDQERRRFDNQKEDLDDEMEDLRKEKKELVEEMIKFEYKKKKLDMEKDEVDEEKDELENEKKNFKNLAEGNPIPDSCTIDRAEISKGREELREALLKLAEKQMKLDEKKLEFKHEKDTFETIEDRLEAEKDALKNEKKYFEKEKKMFTLASCPRIASIEDEIEKLEKAQEKFEDDKKDFDEDKKKLEKKKDKFEEDKDEFEEEKDMFKDAFKDRLTKGYNGGLLKYFNVTSVDVNPSNVTSFDVKSVDVGSVVVGSVGEKYIGVKYIGVKTVDGKPVAVESARWEPFRDLRYVDDGSRRDESVGGRPVYGKYFPVEPASEYLLRYFAKHPVDATPAAEETFAQRVERVANEPEPIAAKSGAKESATGKSFAQKSAHSKETADVKFAIGKSTINKSAGAKTAPKQSANKESANKESANKESANKESAIEEYPPVDAKLATVDAKLANVDAKLAKEETVEAKSVAKGRLESVDEILLDEAEVPEL